MGLCLLRQAWRGQNHPEPRGMPIHGTVICIARGRPRLVVALTAGGVRISAGCCGQGVLEGRRALNTGRSLIIRDSVS